MTNEQKQALDRLELNVRAYIDSCLIAMIKEKLRPFLEEEERRILYGDGHPTVGILPSRKKKRPKKKRGKKRK